MAYDLGALVTRMVVEGRQTFERDIQAGGKALRDAASASDDLGRSFEHTQLGAMGLGAGFAASRAEVLALGTDGRATLRTITTGLAAAGIAAAGLIGLSVAKYAEYDAAISRATAVTGLYGDELAAVRDLTRDLGGTTVFTATEAAQGVTELGKAGISTADILGGALAGSLDLAAAGEIGVAQAAEIAATTLTQFRLEGRQATHVADLLAAGAGKAQGGVTDLSAALAQSGLVASQMGLGVEEAVGTLAAFASAGLIGSDAGTSFRTMLLALATPTRQQTDLLKQYNIQAYDQQGNFVGTTALAGQLQSAFAGVSQAQRDYALGVIFGSDAIRAANVLYQQGADGIADWVTAVDDAGYAARIAGVNQDNLRGDLEKLGGAWDTLMINFGEGANGPIREVLQAVTGLVDGFADLPPEIQQIILLGTALVGGIGLIGGAALIAVPKILEARAALAVLRAEMPLTTAAAGRFASFLAGPWGIAIAAAVLGGYELSKWMQSFEADSAQVTAALKGSTQAVDVLSTSMRNVLGGERFSDEYIAALNDALIESGKVAADWSATYTGYNAEVIGAVRRVGDEVGALAADDLPAAQEAFRLFGAETDGSRERLLQLLDAMPAYRDELIRQATETGAYADSMSEAERDQVLLNLAIGEGAGETRSAAEQYSEATQQVRDLRDELDQLIGLLDEQNKAGQDAITTSADYQQALADVGTQIDSIAAGVDGYAAGLDLATQGGRDNTAMLVDLAKSAWDAASAQLAIDGNTSTFVETLSGARQAIIDAAIAMGGTAEQAETLADSILRIPSETEVAIIAETAAAQRAIDGWITQNNGRRIRVTVDAYGGNVYRVEGSQVGFQEYGSITTVRARAAGAIDVPSNAGALAQIRNAGELTVWAEQASGGEAYIPFAPDRRARSLAIWAEAGRRLGVAGFDQGGVVDGPGTVAGMTGGRQTHIHFHNPVTRDPVASAREAADLLEAEAHV